MACGVLYIIDKLLECRCVKWARIAHLEFETQVMAKRRAESQTTNLTPDQKKSRIDLIYLSTDGMQHIVGNPLTKATTFLETASRYEVCLQNYGVPKSQESQLGRFRDSHLGVPGQKAIWIWASWRGAEYIIRGKVVASPKSRSW
jgi:hypothetical protein